MKTLVAILLLVGACDASAGVGLHWNGCSSPITNYNVEPYSAGTHDLVVTLEGIEGDVDEVDVTLIVFDPCSSDGQFIPQAWRFDAGGCQAGRLSIDRPASLDGCDGLLPAGGATIESVTAAPFNTTIGQHNDPVTYPAIFIRMAQTFPTRHLVSTNRYVIGRIRLDMANTVAGVDPAGKACGCGSAERQIAFFGGTIGGPSGSGPLQGGQGLIEDNAYWAGMDFCVIDKPSPPATTWGADPLCLTTASRSRSWGAVKAHYR